MPYLTAVWQNSLLYRENDKVSLVWENGQSAYVESPVGRFPPTIWAYTQPASQLGPQLGRHYHRLGSACVPTCDLPAGGGGGDSRQWPRRPPLRLHRWLPYCPRRGTGGFPAGTPILSDGANGGAVAPASRPLRSGRRWCGWFLRLGSLPPLESICAKVIFSRFKLKICSNFVIDIRDLGDFRYPENSQFLVVHSS